LALARKLWAWPERKPRKHDWRRRARPPLKLLPVALLNPPVIYQLNQTLDDGGFGSHSHRLLNQSQALFQQPCGLAALKE